MLTIPAEIQALYKRDSVRKNFRVHFPGGEMDDITNANIVQESVTFTESLCSQEVLKFGLTEASCIEFETVGIGNMFGMTIQCYDEIDTSSLTAAQLTAIQADPGDGALVLEADSDLGFGYYQIPLGVFYVDKCPRNHGAMTHRRVTAYTQTVSRNSDMSPAAQAILGNPTRNEKLTVRIPDFIYAGLAYDDSTLLASGYTKSSLVSGTITASDKTTLSAVQRIPIPTASGVTRYFWIRTAVKTVSITIPSTAHLISMDGASAFLAMHEQVMAYITGTGYVTRDEAEAVAQWGRPSWRLAGYSTFGVVVYGHYYVKSELEPLYAATPSTVLRLFPVIQFVNPTAFDEYGRPTAWDVEETCEVPTGTAYTAYGYDTEQEQISFNIPSTLSTTVTQVGGTATYTKYTYYNGISFAKLLAGWLELQGKFGKFGRTGAFEIDALDASSHVAVLPGEYSEMWWDEYDVSPVGAVKYSFGEDGASNTAIYQFGTGTSVYDMTDNYLLQHMADQTEDTINALLDSMFIPNIADIAFTPVDLEMMGYPQMEAGDALSITAEDGTIVNTFAMRQEFAGIQMLTNTIESTGGEIIDAAGMTEEET